MVELDLLRNSSIPESCYIAKTAQEKYLYPILCLLTASQFMQVDELLGVIVIPLLLLLFSLKGEKRTCVKGNVLFTNGSSQKALGCSLC